MTAPVADDATALVDLAELALQLLVRHRAGFVVDGLQLVRVVTELPTAIAAVRESVTSRPEPSVLADRSGCLHADGMHLLRIEKVQERLGDVSRSTVERLLRDGVLTRVHVGRRVGVDEAEVNAYIESLKAKAHAA